MKQRFTLTESQLHNLIKESIKEVLVENDNMEFAKQQYQKTQALLSFLQKNGVNCNIDETRAGTPYIRVSSGYDKETQENAFKAERLAYKYSNDVSVYDYPACKQIFIK